MRYANHSKGFTLLELLVGMGILAILFSIVLIALNPLEQFNKTNDIAKNAVSKDYVKAINTYFTSERKLPWVSSESCKDELSKETTIANSPNCVKELIKSSQLETKVLASNESKDLYVTECSGGVAVCYTPKSTAFKSASDAKYTKDGRFQPGCPGGSDCYACTFSTNDAEECFQALNPNGTLAIVPSPAPDAVVPIPNRHAKPTCSDPASGKVSCMAEVVTNSAGDPLSSLALPAGIGPDQLHKAYNLPCTPGGTVQNPCTTPSSFGPKTLAIVIAYHNPTLESDLAVYSQTYNLPPCTTANGCLKVVNQNGTEGPYPGVDSSWALEEALDAQMTHAICQTCKILVVEANSNYFSDMGAAVAKAAALGADAISNSYGASEFSNELNYDTYYNHPGIFVTASSGDSGYGGSYPAASNHVISVGGTTLSLLANNTYASESVWSGAGSGCSLYNNAQTFQTSLTNWSQTNCGSKRGSTDVAAVADPNTGVAVYDSYGYSGRSGWWILGGTSVSSPIMSAALVLAGSAPGSGDATAYVYQNHNLFRDVTSGTNGTCSSSMCRGTIGYDGPTGLGTPNFSGTNTEPSILTPTPTTAYTPTPTLIATITPTPTGGSCTTQQTVSLNRADPILALPNDTVNNTLSIKNNDSASCSTTFYISSGVPASFTLGGVPASVTVPGGTQTDIPFTLHVPSSATAGNYIYQFWVVKQGQVSVNPVNGSIQVEQVGLTNTPTPTPITCTHAWSNSLGSTSLSGNAGDTLNQTLTITNNNPASCGTATFGISHSYPSGWIILGLPASVQLSGGQSTTIQFTITISTGAQVQDYTLSYWINSGGLPMNATVHVLQTAPPPTGQFFSNFGGKFYGNYALFEYSYNATGNVSGRLDVATDPNALNQTSNPPSTAYYGFAFNSGNAMDASNNATPTSVRGFIVSSPQNWTGWKCGSTFYYRMYNSGDLSIKSPVQSGVVDCTTVVDVLPWGPWYSAIYYGVYDSRYDADNNSIVNWTDYWILVRQTRLR